LVDHAKQNGQPRQLFEADGFIRPAVRRAGADGVRVSFQMARAAAAIVPPIAAHDLSLGAWHAVANPRGTGRLSGNGPLEKRGERRLGRAGRDVSVRNARCLSGGAR
jgi:hypothetical protein